MIDETTTTRPDEASTSPPDETFEWTDQSGNGSAGGSAGATGREWIAQLQAMIENAATQAAPVLREVAAKAAELAAVAGDKAGPVAARAAELTAEAGHRIAERSRDFAADLRRDAAAQAEHGAEPATADQPAEPTKDDAGA